MSDLPESFDVLLARIGSRTRELAEASTGPARPDIMTLRSHLEHARHKFKPHRGAGPTEILQGNLIAIVLDDDFAENRAQLENIAYACACAAPPNTTPEVLKQLLLSCARGEQGLDALAAAALSRAKLMRETIHKSTRAVGGLHSGEENFNASDALYLMDSQFAWIENVQCVAALAGDRLEWRKVDGFRTTWNNRKVVVPCSDGANAEPLGTWWLSHVGRRSFERVGMWPPPLKEPPRAYNLWRGFAVKPVSGDWSLMRAHIRDVIAAGDQNLYAYIVKWIAWAFQNPGARAEAALVLRGTEGIGKGMLGNALARIFGVHAVHVTRPDHFIGGRFNKHMAEAVFFFADECYWAGDRSHEGTLKGLITEPTVRVEPKGIDSYEVDNVLHVLISSNNEWVVPAGEHARRFVITDVSDAHRGDTAYFKALSRETDSGGLAAMLHELLELDLGDWHPREIVDSAALRDQKFRSLHPKAQWTLELLTDATIPRSFVTTGPSTRPSSWAGSDDLLEHARSSIGEARQKWSGKLVAEAMREIGAQPLKHHGERGWALPDLAEARATWSRKYFQVDWNRDTKWQ